MKRSASVMLNTFEEFSCFKMVHLLDVEGAQELVCPIELFPIGFYVLSSDLLN